MSGAEAVPSAAWSALQVWLDHHDERAPGFVEGLYLVGSIALDDWQAKSDIDIIAVSSQPASAHEVEALREAHEATNSDVVGTDIDGPFLTWDDLSKPPTAVVRPWSLQRQFHLDDGCFELNPAIWMTLAEHSLVARGPARSNLDVHVDDIALQSFVRDNTADYWRSVPSSIEAALVDPERTEFSADLTSWSVLGIGRMLYTARTGTITSKSGAGHWLIGELPHHRELVEHALRVRAATDSPPDGRETARATAQFMIEVADLIESTT